MALFSLGCFWAPAEDFGKLPGVSAVTVGYAGGPASYDRLLLREGGVENAPNMSALNIQEIVDVRLHYDMERILARRDDEDASLFIQADEEIQQQLLMNPMNFQSAEAFAASIREIGTNKMIKVQLD